MALLSRKRDVSTNFHVLNVQKEILSKEALGEKMGMAEYLSFLPF